MAVVFPDIGRELALNVLLAADRTPEIKLFKNDITPDQATVLGDLTEADFDSYAAVNIHDASPEAIDGDDRGYRTKTGILFQKGAGATTNTIYGWYLVLKNTAGTEELFMCERFPAPQLMDTDGDEITFDFTLLDELGT